MVLKDNAKGSVNEYESMSAANDVSAEKTESDADKKTDQPENSAQIP